MFRREIYPARAWPAFAGSDPWEPNGFSKGITMQAVQGLFGGGAKKDAEKAAKESRQTQMVANDRQLAEANRNSQAIVASRRAPRGRRLFEDGPDTASAVLA